MDPTSLVEIQKVSGKRLVERLLEEGVDITAAAWLKESEEGSWYLYIATSLVEVPRGAMRDAFRAIHSVIRKTPELSWIRAGVIKVINPHDPIAEAIYDFHRRYSWPTPTDFGGGNFGGLMIDGAYIYPAIAPARVESK